MASLLPFLRLLRVGTLFSPGADVVAGLCLCGLAWRPASIAAVFASIAIYAGGMVLNDFADRGEDAVARPERPLPRGEIGAGTALALGLSLLGCGVLLAPAPLYHLLLAALVLLYDFGGKQVPWLGILLMGTLRGLNLASPMMLAGELPAYARSLLVAAAVAYGGYIAAVTVLGRLEDQPAPGVRSVIGWQLLAPALALAALQVAQDGGFWPAPALAVPPLFLFVRRVARIQAWDQRAIRGSMLWLLLGTMLYTALLAAARGRWPEAIGIAACILPSRWIARRIALT